MSNKCQTIYNGEDTTNDLKKRYKDSIFLKFIENCNKESLKDIEERNFREFQKAISQEGITGIWQK